jgi:MFS family permease
MNLRYEGNVRDVVKSRALLADRRFASLWLSQGIAQTASNAMLFSLLVVILSITGSSVHTSFLVLSFTLPSIPMGIIVGVVLDRVRKDSVLIVTNLVRAGCCVLFFFFHSNEWVIYAISFGFSTAGLFFNPAVVSLIPSLVSRERLVSANSLYNFTLTGSQLVGIVFIAPTVLKLLHVDGMFITAAVLFVIAAAFAARLRGVQGAEEAEAPRTAFGGIPMEFRESWRVLLADRYASLAMAQLMVSSTLVLLFAILIPRYMKDVLDVPPDNAAFVFAPTGIGALVGLRFLPWFTRRGKNRTVIIGLGGIAVSLALLGVVKTVADVTEMAPGSDYLTRLLRVSLLQALTMSFAGPMGFFYSLLNAPAQTVLHERAPPDMRGRIFATQVISANFISLLPLLLFGAVTDLLDVTTVLLFIAVGLVAMAAVSWSIAGNDVPDDGGGPGVADRSPGVRATAGARASGSIDTPRGVG